MEDKSFTTTIEVASSPQSVFTAITAGVAKWWGGKDLTGHTTALHDEFIINHPGAHYSRQRLVEVVPGQRVVWLVTESTLHWLADKQEWQNTKMIFEITTHRGKTILRFTHQGLVPAKECYTACAHGWTTVITDYLYQLLTTGQSHF